MFLKELKELSKDGTLFFVLPPKPCNWILTDLEVYQNEKYDDCIIKEIVPLDTNMIGIYVGYEDEIPVGRAKNLIGQKFDRLTVLYRTKHNNSSDTWWKCQCDCGALVDKRGDSLKVNTYNACPECYLKENLQKNLKNKVFGYLTVINEDGRDKFGRMRWKCKCECGNETTVNSSALIEGQTISCGCFKASKGEKFISDLLIKHSIKFETQKSFKNCVYKKPLRFDFYVNNNYLIEFDGSQHFYATKGSSWNTEENLLITKQRDEFKNQWCKDNGIPLIRIPYTKLDTLCIEDLMLETTKFRIV